MRRAITAVLLISIVAAAAWFLTHRLQPPPSVVTAAVTRGPIVKVVASTGTLQAVTSVDVGAEISGTIASLGADFNSIVRKGQTLATLDPSLLRAAVEQAHANLPGRPGRTSIGCARRSRSPTSRLGAIGRSPRASCCPRRISRALRPTARPPRRRSRPPKPK